MKFSKILQPSTWKLTPKVLFAFLLTAILPTLAASIFSLNYFYNVSFERAQANLVKELGIAKHYLNERAMRLESDTRLAARENLITLNLALDLTAPVLDYLDNLKLQRQLALAELVDGQGQPLDRTRTQLTADPQFLTPTRLARAQAAGSFSFFARQTDGRVLLAALVPVLADPTRQPDFLVMAIDPGSPAPGDSLDLIRQVVSGPVVFGGVSGRLGTAPGDPQWSPQFPWPPQPEAAALIPVSLQGSTFLFGFQAVGGSPDSDSAWVGLSFSLDQFQQLVSNGTKGLLLITFIVIVLAVGAAVAFSRVLTQPLLMMARQASTWTEGLGGMRLEVKTQDETGVLGRTFNAVLDRLDGTLFSLRKTQNYLKNIFNSLASVLVSVDEIGTVQEWNLAAERLNGLASDQALGQKIWDLSPVFQGLEASIKLALDTRQPQFLQKDLGHGRSKQTFDVCLYPLIWNGVSGVVVRMDDITESLRKDQQILQAQKMETVGTLTEGIAHNFNNLLTGIAGSVSLVELELEATDRIQPEELKQRMAMIGDSSRRASEIVRQLMALSRGNSSEFSSVDLVALLRQVAKLSKMVLDNSVEVELDLVPEVALIRGNQSQMEQSLLNLVINASHAMTIMRSKNEHHGGVIKLTLKEVTPAADFLATHPEAPPSDYWKLQVQDSGVGISPDNLTRIFDPFFTTKDLDKGSGLGLAMVYSTVRQHKGYIEVYSELSRGTTFSLHLPAAVEVDSSAFTTVEKKPLLLHRGLGLILVVDDELMVQKTAKLILERCGYDVVTANNGLEALEIYDRQGPEIRAVLLDSSMPKLSGPETLHGLLSRNPDIRVVVSSGLATDQKVKEMALNSSVRFLPKPYSLTELSKVFHDLLLANS